MPVLPISKLLCRSLLLTAVFTGLFCSLAAGAVVLGDVNQDGFANALDVQIAISIILGNESPFVHAADLDKNGQVNAIDLQLVINAVLGYSIPAYVPNVVGMTQEDAEIEIVEAGLTVGEVTEEYHDTALVGDVISQSPAVSTPVSPGSAVGFVVSQGPEAPDVIVDFFATPTQGVSPFQVRFTDASFPGESFVAEADTLEWHWEFGDGEASNEENPHHVYAAPGVYTVRLTINIDGTLFSHRKVDYVKVMAGSSAILDETGGTVASDRKCTASIAKGILPGAIEVRIADTPDYAIRDTLAEEVPIAASVTVELHPTGEPLKTDAPHDFEMTVIIVLDAPLPPGTELDVYRKGESEGSWILLDTTADVDSSGIAATFQTRDIGVFIVREPDEYSTPVLDFDALLAEPEKGLPPPAKASLNKIAGSGPVPIVLIHGAGSYKNPQYARWDRFVEWAQSGGLDLENRYQLWWFLHDSDGRPVGYDFGRPGENKPNNTREFVDALATRRTESDPAKRFPPSTQQFLIVAHSRGGLLARMFTENNPDEVMAVLTLATPHHGSPYAVPDWFFYLIRRNFNFMKPHHNRAAEQVLLLLYRSPLGFDWWEPGQADLAWDDFDGTGYRYGIPYRRFDLLTVFSGGSTLFHTLSANDAGRPYNPLINDTDLHGHPDLHLPDLYAGGRQPGTTLWDITQKSPESAQMRKFILYGGYGARVSTNINFLSSTFWEPTLGERGGSAGLAALAAIMESFETEGEHVSHFAANDGMVPLQSALCLKGSPTEPIYQTYRLLGLFDRIKDPLVLDGVQARLPIPVARVRYQEFEGYNHLDMVTGRLSNVTSIDDNVLFTYIGADLLSTIASVPVAALTIENSSELSVTLEVSDSRDRNTGLWPASSLEYQVDWGDGQIYDWNSMAPTSYTYSAPGDYMIILRVRDRDGMIGFASTNVNMTGSPPSVTSFAINGGAASTASRTVTLNNTCTGNPTHYMASESSSFIGASWKAYSTAPSFTLSSGDGTKTVYFKVKNTTGESSAASDSIELSESPVGAPSVPLPSSPGTTSEPGPVISTLTPTLVCSSVSGATQYEFTISIKPYGTENTVWSDVAADSSGTVAAGHLLAGQEYCWNVRAGNIAGWSTYSDRLYFQTGANSAPEILEYAINLGAPSTRTRTVTLNNTCTGNPTHYMASESSSFEGASWQTYSTAPRFVLSSGDGTKAVYFKVKSDSGESISVSAETLLDHTVPACDMFEIIGVDRRNRLLVNCLQISCNVSPFYSPELEISSLSNTEIDLLITWEGAGPIGAIIEPEFCTLLSCESAYMRIAFYVRGFAEVHRLRITALGYPGQYADVFVRYFDPDWVVEKGMDEDLIPSSSR